MSIEFSKVSSLAARTKYPTYRSYRPFHK